MKKEKKEDDENIHGFIDELPSRGGTDDGIHTLVDCSNLTKLIPKGSDEFTTASDPVTMNGRRVSERFSPEPTPIKTKTLGLCVSR